MKILKAVLAGFWAVALVVSQGLAQTPTQPKAQKLIDQLVGKWQLTRIMDGEKEADTSHHKSAMRQIEFTREAKYISTNPKMDSGFFRTNEDHKRLYLENASDNQYPKEWNIKLDNNDLVLSTKQPAKMKRYRYVYIRIETDEKARK